MMYGHSSRHLGMAYANTQYTGANSRHLNNIFIRQMGLPLWRAPLFAHVNWHELISSESVKPKDVFIYQY